MNERIIHSIATRQTTPPLKGNTIMAITTKTLASLIAAVAAAGTTFAGMRIKTTPKQKGGKKNPYQGRVQRVATVNAILGTNYEKVVNDRLQKEGKERDFVASPSNVGGPILDKATGAWTGFLYNDNTGNTYLQFMQNSSTTEGWLLDGQPAEFDEAWQVYTSSSKPTQGGLVNSVNVRTVTVDNIMELRVNGMCITL